MSEGLKTYNQVKQEIAINEVVVRSMSYALKLHKERTAWCKWPIMFYTWGLLIIGSIYSNLPMIIGAVILSGVSLAYLQAGGMVFNIISNTIKNAENVKGDYIE